MLTNGEQKIFIWIDFSPETEVAVLHGLQVALILGKEVCLICLVPEEHAPAGETESRLKEIAAPLVTTLGSASVHTLVTSSPLSMLLTELAEEYDALLLVAPKARSSELLPQLPHSGFPFLFVSDKLNVDISYQNIVVPVSYMKKSKDLALWSSYFARHNGARISLIRAHAGLEEDKKRVNSILLSIERLFRNFSFPYEIIDTATSTWKIQKRALEQAMNLKNGLLIISFTHHSSFIDRLLGIDDTFLIDHAASFSVMCINSQRDLYTLCG